ncbi:hypothetical protein TSOC_010327 [Tetrabaena socialis]|uniref:phytol kinase n=1 Tax=Tetrabaena socialis TaxID=47790 RepID=A0A2J7ZTK1_9CHLO|nr:hypothetical protein TSOC_010327 [Tetrabaena socialis]|eukprot:PNH03601.1 hypothetical protein TSOC_010327 [Tetrabaena socialis]
MSSARQPAPSRPAQAAAILRSLPGLAERLRSRLPPHRVEDLQELRERLSALRPLVQDSTAAPALLSNAAARGALLGVLAGVAAHSDGEEAELAQLRQELAGALRDSCVLEHAARTLLLLLDSRLQHADEDGNDCQNVLGLFGILDRIAERLPCSATAGPAASEHVALAAALRGVMSGRCVQHAVLVCGLVALCAADGGPSYGLPGELLQRVPLIGLRQGPAGAVGGFDLRLISGRQVLDFWALRSMVCALGSGDRVAPPGRHGALALLLRVGRLAVASGRSHLAAGGESGAQAAAESGVRQERGTSTSTSASASGSGSGSGSGNNSSRSSRGSGSHGPQQVQAAATPQRPHPPSMPRLELVLDENALQPLFSGALEAAMALCFPAGPADRPQLAAARVECWRLFADYTRDVLPLRPCDPLPASPVRHLADPGQLMPGAPLPDSPPPSWADALAGGWLPCLERLLRRGGEDPAGPELQLSSSTLFINERTALIDWSMSWRHLAVLLAYGEPRQAAALVATLGKLLRAADPVRLADAVSKGSVTPAGAALWMLEGAGLELSTTVAAASGAGGQAQGGLPCGAPSAAGRQLALMLSYALCDWLPPLARLVARAMQEAALCGTGGQQRVPATPGSASRRDAIETAGALLYPLLVWLPALLPRCNVAVDGAAAACGGAAGAGSSSGGNGPDDDGCGGWRQLLLKEMGAVQLLGTALHVFAAAAPADLPPGMLLRLVRACCAFAVAFPREVRTAASRTAGGQASTRRGLGEQLAGAAPGLGHSGAAAASQPRFPWWPRLLQALAGSLRAEGHGAMGDCAEALAAVLQSWEAGGGVGAGGEAASSQAQAEVGPGAGVPPAAWRRVEEGSTCFDARVVERLLSTLVPVAEARGVLRTCSHPGCVSLAGDSEAEAEAGLLECGRCGASRYCCADCQAAHWRAGHREACVPRD